MSTKAARDDESSDRTSDHPTVVRFRRTVRRIGGVVPARLNMVDLQCQALRSAERDLAERLERLEDEVAEEEGDTLELEIPLVPPRLTPA